MVGTGVPALALLMIVSVLAIITSEWGCYCDERTSNRLSSSPVLPTLRASTVPTDIIDIIGIDIGVIYPLLKNSGNQQQHNLIRETATAVITDLRTSSKALFRLRQHIIKVNRLFLLGPCGQVDSCPVIEDNSTHLPPYVNDNTTIPWQPLCINASTNGELFLEAAKEVSISTIDYGIIITAGFAPRKGWLSNMITASQGHPTATVVGPRIISLSRVVLSAGYVI